MTCSSSCIQIYYFNLLIDNVFWLIFIFALEIYDANNNWFQNKLNVLVYDGSVSPIIIRASDL